ncbi:MAG TPA: hypothetical protein VKU00_06440 [Chthonomonadaceae bacterium]|nr:hypothetical protein [Chthonomonadaceae bacterium]
MLNLKWTVDVNGRVAAAWEPVEGAEGMPLSLVLMEEAPAFTTYHSTRFQDMVAHLRVAIFAALRSETRARS